MVNGVAQVNVFGAQKYAVRVQPDPRLLAIRQFALDDVAAAVQRGSTNLPLGTLYTGERNYTIRGAGQPRDAAGYRNLTVAYRNGAPIYLKDVATVIDSVENTRSASWLNGRRGMTLGIQKQPGTNTLQVIDDIKAVLPAIQADLPPSVQVRVLFDRSVSIRNSINDIQFTLLLTIALVVLVIYLFLGSLSATWIAALALPMAIIGTFALMGPLGFSLNNLSLMALTLSVGFVIDDAIVVLENISRHRERGEPPLQAALNGTREITFTVLSMTSSLVAVFIPILFMGGLLGRLFNEFAVTMAVAILVSGFISLSLTPMLCSRFLRPHAASWESERKNPVIALSTGLFSGMERFYRWSLGYTLAARPLVLLLFVALCAWTVFLFGSTPKGFIPTEDTGQISGTTEALQGTSFPDMMRYQRQVAGIVQRHPGVAAVMSSVESTNNGRLFITLKPARERKKAEVIIAELRPQLGRVPGIQTFLQLPPSIRLGGRSGKAVYQYTLQSPDPEALYKATTDLEKRLATLPALQDVNSDLQIKNPELRVAVQPDKMTALGLSRQAVENVLGSAFGSRQIATIYTPSNDYQVVMELSPEFQRSIDVLNLLYVRSASNTLVPLSTFTQVTRAAGPLSINHQGQFPATTISFNLPPGVALGDVVGPIEAMAAQTLPPNVHAQFQGTAEAFQDSMQGLGWLLVVAVVVIYIVLGVLYESFIHPITILSGLPPAGLGALLTLNAFGQELNIYGFLGLIMLIGIVKKNAIMMIDFAVDARRAGKAPEEAIHEAALVRFRPIMMTTLAALMGTLPIAIGWGEGVEARRALGLAVFGGLLVSQVLTLYITPVLYVVMERIGRAISNREAS
jgi:HAE1 family hydrophobic/amphiphilic exporter-1